MLTVIRTIVLAIAAFEAILLVLSGTIIPENRIIKCIDKHKNLQIAFGIILYLGILLGILE